MPTVRTTPTRLILAIFIALAGVLSYFSTRSTNDVTGEVQHVRLSPRDEVALGLQAGPAMAQQYGGVVRDPGLAGYVEAVGRRVVERSSAGKTEYPFEFHLLADPQTLNAFALPGGQVFITLGLLKELRSEAQVAGVLGHEVGHVVGRHGAEHLAQAELSQSLVGAVGVAVTDPDDPAAGRRAAAMAAAVAQLVNMKYGRGDELESDALGVRFMSEAGYEPRAMIEVMQVLARAGGGRRTPEFFSTHPSPENRLARLEELVRAAPATKGETGEKAFEENVLRRLR